MSKKEGMLRPPVWALVKEVVTLSGIWGIIFESKVKELEQEDLPTPLPWFTAHNEALEEDVLSRWGKSHDRHTSKKEPGRIGWAVIFSQLRPLKGVLGVGMIFSACQGLLATVGRFLVLRALIRGISDDSHSKKYLVGLAFLFSAISVFEGLSQVIARQLIAGHLFQMLMARNNALLINKVHKVSAATSTSAATSRSANEMPALSALYAADIPRMLSFVRFLSLLPCGVISLFGGIIVISVYLGFGVVVALGCMLVLGSAQHYSSAMAKKDEPHLFNARDHVVAAIKQAIKAMKAVKFYAWEDQYANLVKERRKEQAVWMVKFRMHYVLTTSIGKSFVIVATVATLVFTASRRNFRLETQDAFSVLAVFHTIRLGMTIVPMSIVLFNTFVNIHDRIGLYLEAPEDKQVTLALGGKSGGDVVVSIQHLKSTLGGGGDAASSKKKKKEEEEEEKTQVFTLNIRELTVKKGQMIAVVGQVGSGKTALSHALLGRLEHTGTVEVYSEFVGYAPQEPFVVSGTVSENIVMGRHFDDKLLNHAIEMASFGRDVEILPDGVATVVGERGTTLSGGQQARLQVARALYGNPKFVVLDSSFAAVDAKVARDMFDRLKNWVSEEPDRGAVVVLSQLHFLPEFDGVYVLEDGDLIAKGTANDIVDKHYAERYEGTDFLGHLVRTLKDGGGSSEVELGSSSDEEDEVAAIDKKAQFMTEKTVGKLDVVPSSKKVTQELTHRKKGVVVVDEKEPEKLVKKEKIQRGVISWRVFRSWARGAGYLKLAAILAIYYGATLVLFASDIILSQWTTAKSDRTSWMGAYVGVALFYVPMIIGGAVSYVLISVHGASGLHAKVFNTVLKAPVGWFDATPTGRIVSRFAADFDIVDIEWAQRLDSFTTLIASFTTFVFAICVVVPMLIPINFLAFYGLVRTLMRIDIANRDLKRLANAAVAPCVTNAQEAENGRVVAAAVGASEFFRERQRNYFNRQLAAFFASTSVSQAAYLSSTAWCSLMSLAASLVIVLIPEIALPNPSVAPVALTYALVMPYFASMASELSLQMSLFATSLERVFEYLPDKRDGGGMVPREPPHVIPDTDAKLPPDWPARGSVIFDNVQLRYREGLPLALASASFRMDPGEKIGVVGRTGAGKSSLFIALFRLVDACGGRILVDGVDISTLGLTILRKRLCLIPQDAVLMQGTGKMNCDPFNEYDDDTVAEALETVGLPRSCLHQTLVTNDGDATSLSTGERQLLALARCLLRRSTVVCFDEATAHMDSNTDVRIQQVIAKEFQRSTLLAIAHRLHTVIGYDKLVVMRDGIVAQYGLPLDLINDSSGPFADMCAALGPKAVADLTDLATTAAAEKKIKETPTLPPPPANDDDVVLNVEVVPP